jgi:hypothetical protein
MNDEMMFVSIPVRSGRTAGVMPFEQPKRRIQCPVLFSRCDLAQPEKAKVSEYMYYYYAFNQTVKWDGLQTKS